MNLTRSKPIAGHAAHSPSRLLLCRLRASFSISLLLFSVISIIRLLIIIPTHACQLERHEMYLLRQAERRKSIFCNQNWMKQIELAIQFPALPLHLFFPSSAASPFRQIWMCAHFVTLFRVKQNFSIYWNGFLFPIFSLARVHRRFYLLLSSASFSSSAIVLFVIFQLYSAALPIIRRKRYSFVFSSCARLSLNSCRKIMEKVVLIRNVSNWILPERTKLKMMQGRKRDAWMIGKALRSSFPSNFNFNHLIADCFHFIYSHDVFLLRFQLFRSGYSRQWACDGEFSIVAVGNDGKKSLQHFQLLI